jgi:hypothetical protein
MKSLLPHLAASRTHKFLLPSHGISGGKEQTYFKKIQQPVRINSQITKYSVYMSSCRPLFWKNSKKYAIFIWIQQGKNLYKYYFFFFGWILLSIDLIFLTEETREITYPSSVDRTCPIIQIYSQSIAVLYSFTNLNRKTMGIESCKTKDSEHTTVVTIKRVIHIKKRIHLS